MLITRDQGNDYLNCGKKYVAFDIILFFLKKIIVQ